MIKAVIWVVAGALQRDDGAWLMHRRPPEKHHGGLWEFPGGKVETTEIPVEALARELSEELGITIQEHDCEPVTFAEKNACAGKVPIVILLYRLKHWEGDPQSLEGGAAEWFAAEAIANLDMPPLDQQLARRLFEKA